MNKLGKIAKYRGFKLCFHHHMATVVQTIEETKRLMNNTNPEYVYLCYDTGHFTFSGEDAVEEGYKFRKAVLKGCFTVPGAGSHPCQSFRICIESKAIYQRKRRSVKEELKHEKNKIWCNRYQQHGNDAYFKSLDEDCQFRGGRCM